MRPRAIAVSRAGAEAWAAQADNFVPDAHVDYARTLTPEGGVELTYKDLDRRWRILIARVLLWSAASGIEGWILLRHSPLQNGCSTSCC